MLTTGRGTAIFEKRSIDPPGLETCRNALFAFYARKSPLSPLFQRGVRLLEPFLRLPLAKGDNSGDSGCPLQPEADPSEALWRIREHDGRKTLTSFANFSSTTLGQPQTAVVLALAISSSLYL
jgi:hypothetical protein